MIPGYDFYAEEEDPSPYRWVVSLVADGKVISTSAANPFRDDADAAHQLAERRKMFAGYDVKILKDGQVWEPTS